MNEELKSSIIINLFIEIIKFGNTFEMMATDILDDKDINVLIDNLDLIANKLKQEVEE